MTWRLTLTVVKAMVFTGWGVVSLFGAMLLIAVGLSAARWLADGVPFAEAFDETLCKSGNIVGSLLTPGANSVPVSRIKMTTREDDTTIDFTGIGHQWTHVCLTSTESGDLTFQYGADDTPRFAKILDICWKAATTDLLVLTVNQHGLGVPLRVPVGWLKAGRAWESDYSALPSGIGPHRQCSPTERAVASCVHPAGGDRCFFLFPR